MRSMVWNGAICFFALICQPAVADSAPGPDDLTLEEIEGLSLEALLNIPVTSVAGVEQDWFKTPASITVLTAEDIRRSGAQSIAEALRLVPGMFVGRSGSHSWRIGARGFSGGLAPRNLVLIDGRVVYDPLFGGVFWEVQDTILSDIDRIEVIRGPGPTLWGANAVNGVINIVTKSAEQTQGLRANAVAGTYEKGLGSVRYGQQISEATAARVYGKYVSRDQFDGGPTDPHDDWSMAMGGFRLDHRLDPSTLLTITGEGYASVTMGEPAGLPGDQQLGGAHILARLDRASSPDAGWSFQQYYDRTSRDQASLNVARDTFDVQFQHHFNWRGGDTFVWGFEDRFTDDSSESSQTIILDPSSRTLNNASAFVQNTFALVPDRWFLMLGNKVEHETYTGFHLEPSARLSWTPDEHHTGWAAISRAVRTPSRLENESAVGVTTGAGFVPIILPGGDLRAEELVAYELGWRAQPRNGLTFDTALFYNNYSDLISLDPNIANLVPAAWNNEGSGRSYGTELSADWQAMPNWRLIGSYSLLRVSVGGPVFDFDSGDVPRQQVVIRSLFNASDRFEINSVVYYVDELRRPGIPEYVRLDLGVTYHANRHTEIALWGQNLANDRIPETSETEEFPRGAYLRVTFDY